MSQQYNKVEKRKRRLSYLKRRKKQHKQARKPAPVSAPASTSK